MIWSKPNISDQTGVKVGSFNSTAGWQKVRSVSGTVLHLLFVFPINFLPSFEVFDTEFQLKPSPLTPIVKELNKRAELGIVELNPTFSIIGDERFLSYRIECRLRHRSPVCRIRCFIQDDISGERFAVGMVRHENPADSANDCRLGHIRSISSHRIDVATSK